MKILNLYSGIGGNRRLWKGDITAIEYDFDIANLYKTLFPKDKVIITDAHDYLINEYNNFDFIWSSPPCQSHSKIRQFVGVNAKGYSPIYPDMKLYQEIIFLQYNFKGKWIVENVEPYYKSLIQPTKKIGRHLFWSNFNIDDFQIETQNLRSRNKISDVEDLHNFNLDNYKIKNKRQLLRNCVDSKLGLHILNCVLKSYD